MLQQYGIAHMICFKEVLIIDINKPLISTIATIGYVENLSSDIILVLFHFQL